MRVMMEVALFAVCAQAYICLTSSGRRVYRSGVDRTSGLRQRFLIGMSSVAYFLRAKDTDSLSDVIST